MKAKEKNIIFHISGVLLHLLYLFIGCYWSFQDKLATHDFLDNFFIDIFVILVFFVVVFIITFALNINLLNNDNFKCNISLYIKSLRKNSKWIYHSNVGYFYCVIESNRIIIYQQEYFNRIELETFQTDRKEFTTEKLSIDIKNYLDSLYQERIKKQKKKVDTNARLKVIKNWDGFLDVVGRRDGKIDKLLK